MLFNSFEFIFLFMPLMVLLYWLANNHSQTLKINILLLGSIFFYGYWEIKYLLLICVSIVTNYAFAMLILRNKSKIILFLSILFNLSIIAYYKYSYFFASLCLSDHNIPNFLKNIALPLAISFFTFQQIAFVVDTYKNMTKPDSFCKYALFVTYFPQLIAGPIVRYQEISSIFNKSDIRKINNYLFLGLFIFIIGLLKKTCIADNLSTLVDMLYSREVSPGGFTTADAWLGTISYTFQLYFDFSGYSDMAIGIAYMMGTKLPINFNSPYKSTSIIEFWRRWHITLSRFFKDYLYIPLGGKKVKFIILPIVMLLTGLWHGAGITFVAWGAYHGVLLLINHLFRTLCYFCRPIEMLSKTKLFRACGFVVTFSSVSLGWIIFRSKSLEQFNVIIYKMFNTSLSAPVFVGQGEQLSLGLALLLCFVICTLFPNTSEIFHILESKRNSIGINSTHNTKYTISLERANIITALLLGSSMYFIVASMISGSSEFLYFNF